MISQKPSLPLLVILSTLAMLSSLRAEDVRIQQAPDMSVTVEAKTYSAAFDSGGKWKSLIVGGREMLGEGAPFPSGGSPASINVRGQLLAMRNDKVIVEFSFEPQGFELSIEGSNMQIGLTPQLTAIVTGKQGVKGPDVKNVADVQKVIAGDSAFGITPGVVYRDGKLLVFAQAGSSSKSVRLRFECGIAAAADDLVELSDFEVIGPPTKTVAQIAGGEPVKLQALVKNLSPAPVSPVLVYTVSNALAGGQTSEPVTLPALSLAPGASQKVEIPIGAVASGIHWVNIELRKNGGVLQRERTSFVYDAPNFRPASTRPADFADFWKSRISAMREVPMNPKIEEVPERSSDAAVHNQVTIAGPKGEPVTFDLQVPRKPGKYLAVFGGKLPDKAENPNQILLVFPHKQWPEEATYNRWVAEDDNNHLDCYLLAVRLADYLRSREDVTSIFLKGASRQGPIQLANAALDPARIIAVDAHVPTSMGLSWTVLPYRGWGKTPVPPSMAAYVDPVNFAPDLMVPVIFDEGVYDGLSPAPGAIAFFNTADKSPWKRLSIEPGGHGFFTSGFRKQATAELEKFLGQPLEASIDDKVMKEH